MSLVSCKVEYVQQICTDAIRRITKARAEDKEAQIQAEMSRRWFPAKTVEIAEARIRNINVLDGFRGKSPMIMI